MERQEHEGPVGLTAGWPSLLCLAVTVALLLPLEAVEGSLGDAPRLAWCALLWVATLSLPQAAHGGDRWSVGLGFGLCVLGLAAHADGSRGVTAETLWAIAWPTLLFAVLLGGAASRAREAGTSTRYAIFWFLLVPCAPLFMHALTRWGGAPIPGWLELFDALSPLSWLAETAGGSAPLPWLPLGVAVLLFFAATTSFEAATKESA